MNVLVKYPTRARPDVFRSTLGLYQRDPTASFLISIDADDATMNNPDMLGFLDAQPRLTYRVGNSKSKIEAVNDGVAEADWQLLLLASDDMVPQRDEYAMRIRQLFDEFFPDGDGVLHLNDGNNGRNLNTLCICDRRYFDRFGYLYHPQYQSLWADNEWQEVSERLGRAIYVNELIIAHDWIGTYKPDRLHLHNESFYQHDERIFRQRKAAGFPA
jgi:hypothetical protein